MIKVNLLPPEMLAERGRQASLAKIYKVAGSITALLLSVFALQLAFTLQASNNVKAIETERLAVEVQVEAYKPVVELQNKVRKRQELVIGSIGAPLPWRDTMGVIGLHIPGNVWLTNVSVVDEGEKGTLILRGMTYDHPSTANWASILGEISGVSDVKVAFSAEELQEQRPLVRFEVRAKVDAAQDYDPLQERGE